MKRELKARSHSDGNDIIFIFLAIAIINGFNAHSWQQRQWKKMGIMMTNGIIHIVTVMENKKKRLIVFAVALAVWTSL